MKKILIVDNSSAVRILITIELEPNDYEITQASSGEEMLELVSELIPDLITIKVELPGIDGYETCSQLRAHEDENIRNIPVVFITTYDTMKEREKGFNAGATDFITKSFKKGELFNAISRILHPLDFIKNSAALIVDNSKSIQMILADCLKGLVENIKVASSGEEALKILAIEKDLIDILITDYMLPGIKGDELCNRVKHELGLIRLPIIFISNVDDKDCSLNMFKAGASDYMHKPFAKEELLARITVHLESVMLYKKLQKEAQILELTNEELTNTKNALWGEMKLAKKIQTVLVPSKPGIPEYEISVHTEPADEVGGDYYDIINVDGFDWLVIGDVSGHGVSAGLIMMMAQTAIHATLWQNPKVSPSKLLALINRTIRKNIILLNEEKYMTITIFSVIKDGQFIFSGLHQDIYVYRAQLKTVDIIKTDGTWIGIEDEIEGLISDNNLTLNIGDTMLLYTDGITESWLKKDAVKGMGDPEQMDMFGYERLRNILNKFGELSTEKIKDGILSELENYDCDDDVSMVILKRTG